MKSRETLIRLKKFQVDEKRRKVAQIEAMIAEFDRIAGELEREIKVEQDRAGIHDPAHFAYPTYAKAATARRENLKHSTDELRVQLEDAKSCFGRGLRRTQEGRNAGRAGSGAREGGRKRARTSRARSHRSHAVQRRRRAGLNLKRLADLQRRPQWRRFAFGRYPVPPVSDGTIRVLLDTV